MRRGLREAQWTTDMSYILDALKKADAQRERDPARGIHAQPAALVPSRRGSDGPSPWIWAGAAALLAAAGAGWYVAQERLAAVVPAQVALQSAVAPATPVAVAPAAPVPVSRPQLAAQAAPQSAFASAPVAAAVLPPPEPARATADEIAHRDDRRAARRHNRVPARSAAVAASAAAPAAAAAAAIPARPAASGAMPAGKSVAAAAPAAEAAPMATRLPPDAPKLAISGGVYIPLEIEHLVRGDFWISLVALAVNVAVVGVMVFALLRRRPGAGAAPMKL